MPSIRPPSPNTTFSTTSVVVRLMQITPSPISRASSGSVAARRMPSATAASAGASLRFHTTTSAPASCRCRAMARPMLPSPTNPILCP